MEIKVEKIQVVAKPRKLKASWTVDYDTDFPMKPEWKFKLRNGWWETYYSPQGPEMPEVYSWCYRTFGELGERWEQHGGWIKFRNEQDVVLFKMKWS